MSTEIVENRSTKMPKVRRILWISFIVSIVLIVLMVVISSFFSIVLDTLGIILSATSLVIIISLMLTSNKYYNWTLPLIGVFFLGLFFKMNHWPGASVLISTSCLMVFFNLLFFSVKSFFVLKHNFFLKWFSFFTGIALALFMYAFMSKVQHWPLFMEFWILKNIINLLLILLVLVIIFKLPGLNYASWPQIERIVFYRQILLPLVIIFSFDITLFVLPDIFVLIFNWGWETHPWGMNFIPLKELEGISLHNIYKP